MKFKIGDKVRVNHAYFSRTNTQPWATIKEVGTVIECSGIGLVTVQFKDELWRYIDSSLLPAKKSCTL